MSLLLSIKICLAEVQQTTFASFYDESKSDWARAGQWTWTLASCVPKTAGLSLAGAALCLEDVGSNAWEHASESFNYAKFAEDSRSMASLPLPRNTSGPQSYRAAIEVLANSKYQFAWDLVKNGDVREAWATLNSPEVEKHHLQLINEAIAKLRTYDDERLSAPEDARKQTLLALLFFVRNEYGSAKKSASSAYELARSAKINGSLPAFIYATTMLYDRRVDFNRSIDLLWYSLQREPDNPMTPMMFSIYLERVMYRLSDGQLDWTALERLTDLTARLDNDGRRTWIQQAILNQLVSRLAFQKEKIEALTGTASATIKGSERTLATVTAALSEYSSSLKAAQKLINMQSASLADRQQKLQGRGKIAWLKDYFQNILGKPQEVPVAAWEKTLQGNTESIAAWGRQQKGLSVLVSNLEGYQNELRRQRSVEAGSTRPATPERAPFRFEGYFYWLVGAGAILVLVILGCYRLRRV